MNFSNATVTDFVTLIFLFAVFWLSDSGCPGLQRRVQPEELWLYRYPHMKSYFSSELLYITAIIIPPMVIYPFAKPGTGWADLRTGLFGTYFSVLFNGCVTNLIKLIIGKPRPDFLARCYPSGSAPRWDKDGYLECDGPVPLVMEGYKSLPSGHASISFAAMVFLSLFLMGKLRVFRGRGPIMHWTFVVSTIPFCAAIAIALSRTIDYHHHREDVLIGSIIGTIVATITYFRHYPLLTSKNCDMPRELLVERKGSDTNNDLDESNESNNNMEAGNLDRDQFSVLEI